MTDLEATILGVVWRTGPCTAYAVRQEFSRSIAQAWSSSAGTIYPIVRRLTQAGLLDTQAGTDNRRTQLLTITDAGRQALQTWMLRMPAWLGPSVDPVRSRLLFADILDDQQQSQLRRVAAQGTLAAVKVAEDLARRLDEEGRHAERDAIAGAALELRCRLDWLSDLDEAARTRTGHH